MDFPSKSIRGLPGNLLESYLDGITPITFIKISFELEVKNFEEAEYLLDDLYIQS